MGKKRGKSAKNARKGLGSTEPEEIVKAPHSFVINRGKLGKNANELMMNFRKIMEPFTAAHLRVQKHNVVKDFVHMAGPLNVSHLVIFTKSQTNMYLRILKLPRGPTLTFQIKEYSLVKDIVSSQKKPLMYEKLFSHHPLLVLNNFSGEGMHFKLMATMFQNMFPSINVNKVNLNAIRRCLLLHYSDDGIELRQYAIKIVPTGVSKAVKKLIQSKVPDLSKFQDVDEFLQKSGNLSESEVELDSAANTVVLPQPISSRGNIASEKSAIRLYEIGPRLKLMLIKIEEGLMTGEVMYHKFIQRTPEEIKALKEKIKAKRLLKEKRRAEQQKNVERKKKLAEKKEVAKDKEAENNSENEDDAEWYRTEVGEEPDENILPGLKRKRTLDKEKPSKKKKYDKNVESGKDKRSKKKKFDKNVKSGKDKLSKKNKIVKSTEGDKDKPKKTKTNPVEEFMRKKKKRKEAKEAKKKAKNISKRVLNLKVKRREIKGKKYKKK